MDNLALFIIYINIVIGIVNLANLQKDTPFWLRCIIGMLSGTNFLIVIILVCQYIKG